MPKTQTTLVISRLQKDGTLATKITKQAGNQIVRVRDMCDAVKKVPELTEAATEAVVALTKLINFVDLT